jgi:hypothetical protein
VPDKRGRCYRTARSSFKRDCKVIDLKACAPSRSETGYSKVSKSGEPSICGCGKRALK